MRQNASKLRGMTTALAPPPPQALAGMELFRGLSGAALVEVRRRARVRRLAKDTVVFRQGATAAHCYAVTDGRVRITQSDVNGAQLVVRFVGPGEMFGTVAFFTDGKYPAEATAVIDSVAISWTEADLLDLIAGHPPIALNIVKILGARIREVQERLREVATQRVECRIANAVLRLADQAVHGAADGRTIVFPVTRKDIAEMCGATLHTVSRVLTAWEKAGLLATKQQRITIRQLEAIRRIASELPLG
jgi:CRP-like cAMP-binding protein